MNTLDIAFQQSVQTSRVLTVEQKQDFLEGSTTFPDEYKEKVTSLLSNFDQHSHAREAYLKHHVDTLLTQLQDQLKQEQVSNEVIAATMKKARSVASGLFSSTAA